MQEASSHCLAHSEDLIQRAVRAKDPRMTDENKTSSKESVAGLHFNSCSVSLFGVSLPHFNFQATTPSFLLHC